MRIVFLGAGAFGLPTLERLCDEHEAVAVVTQPDRPAGRGKALTPTPIGAWAQEHSLNVIKTANVNAPDVCAQVRDIDADAWVVIAFGQKLSETLLADRFAINLHASLLPRWRGAAPINHAILAGDAQTGNSVITLAQRMDAGLILGQSHRPIEPHETAGELHDLLAGDGPALVLRVLAEHAAGSLHPIEQDESLVTLAGKFSREDGYVDFSQSASACRNRIHGLTPWPGVRIRIADLALKALRAQVARHTSQEEPGTLISAREGLVTCGGGGVLQLVEVQPEGKRPMTWDALMRGREIANGVKVQSP